MAFIGNYEEFNKDIDDNQEDIENNEKEEEDIKKNIKN